MLMYEELSNMSDEQFVKLVEEVLEQDKNGFLPNESILRDFIANYEGATLLKARNEILWESTIRYHKQNK